MHAYKNVSDRGIEMGKGRGRKGERERSKGKGEKT